ncbi:AraC family transcriptional regulator [Bacteroides helcogenes]|uniref:Transcriptional regulator, AraC family n=1 Tax=Bacteroides helcogenes (strain ATCC 35417 / DSM 20613 / JCM 6297 / CCUG 15421 / P 36-108) TaxID=693979 RepID=E6SVP0_BACT6|nr:helix-turn-helix domain-containing protein [Bacteroides helcogenes]ADV43501.1 transcriptional regulator, AraC family [Bacteroides helcogenes P 36-108]MDY5239227.1 helix-turn-helix domain-containing protein [Bacteroides helcogenes]
MEELIKLDHVCQYNEMLGQETLHPLVSVIDFSKCKPQMYRRQRFGFYTIFLKDTKCGDLHYGRSYYDYQEGTLVFLAPGQIMGISNRKEKFQPKGYALVFHPDLLRGTPLARMMNSYTFFSYESNEALHLSEQERRIILECLHNIEEELQHSIDKHSKSLIVNNIELLLNYCMRFYDRQFITRSNVNKDILTKFEHILNDYFQSDKPQDIGLPSVQYCAEQLHLSPNYFGDLIKKETGNSPQEHIQLKLIDTAKEKIFDPSKTISEIAYELGFKYPQHFTRLFKKVVGCAPNEYRQTN